jgi:hypothetical protein
MDGWIGGTETYPGGLFTVPQQGGVYNFRVDFDLMCNIYPAFNVHRARSE